MQRWMVSIEPTRNCTFGMLVSQRVMAPCRGIMFSGVGSSGVVKLMDTVGLWFCVNLVAGYGCHVMFSIWNCWVSVQNTRLCASMISLLLCFLFFYVLVKIQINKLESKIEWSTSPERRVVNGPVDGGCCFVDEVKYLLWVKVVTPCTDERRADVRVAQHVL